MAKQEPDTVYVAVQGTPYHGDVETTTTAYEYYVIPKEPKKRRQCGCGTCCCILAVILTIFFLVPRTPSVWLSKLTLSADSENVPVLYGSFAYQNNNYFEVDWTDGDLDLFWLPDDGQLIAPVCSGSTEDPNAACEFYDKGWCAINLGSFLQADKKLTTESRQTKHSKYTLTQTTQQAACATQIVLAQAAHGKQRMLSKGSVKAKGTVRNFGRVHVSSSYYYLA